MEVEGLIKICLEMIPGTKAIKSGVLLESENLEIYPLIKMQEERDGAYITMLEFEAEHDDKIDDMIVDYATALGESEEESIREATRVWVEGTLPVIRNFLNNDVQDSLPVEKGQIQVGTESGEVLQWTAYVGALQGVGLENACPASQQALINILRPQLEPLLAVKADVWVRAVITQYGENYDIDCMLNNQNWPNGFEELYKWTQSWEPSEGLQMRRQFIYFKLEK